MKGLLRAKAASINIIAMICVCALAMKEENMRAARAPPAVRNVKCAVYHILSNDNAHCNKNNALMAYDIDVCPLFLP